MASATAQSADVLEFDLPELIVPGLPGMGEDGTPAAALISLDDAIEIALQNNPQLQQNEAEMHAASGRTKSAMSALLPSITVSSQYTKTQQDIPGGAIGGTFTTSDYTANIAGRQLIFDFGRTPAQVSQARRREDASRFSHHQNRQDIIDRVKQSYYSLLQTQRLVQVQKQNVSDQEAHLGLARARFETGLAPRADLVRAQTSVAQALLTLANAQNATAAARLNLNLVLGLDIRTPTQVEETEEASPALPAPEDLVEAALTNRPDMRRAQASVKAATEALKSARAAYLPALYINGNYGLRGADFPPDDDSWSYGATLSWTLFDSGATRGRVKEAQGSLMAAQASLQDTSQRVASEVVQAYLDIQTAVQKVAASEAEVASAQENLSLATGRYQAGVAVYIEVIDAETAMVTARTNHVNALFDLSVARASLERALGTDKGEI